MIDRIAFIATVILLSASCLGKQAEDEVLPASYVQKVDSTPDLMQTDPTLGLLEGGVLSCASVAATNGFAWLADHGFENMLLRGEDGSVSYARTAQAMDRVLQLATNRGALPPSFLRGVARYLSERGYTDEDYRLEFQGRSHPEGLQGTRIPNIDAVKKGVVRDGAAWLFVGFYRFDEREDEYQTISYHYVSLVGYGVDEYGNEDPNVLILHDPAPRSGPGVSHDYVHIEQIEHGRITVPLNSQSAPADSEVLVDASGYYKLGDGLAYNDKADIAILVGAILLEMK